MTLYDESYVRWCQDQAEVLTAMDPAAHPRLDIGHLIYELEGLGKDTIRDIKATLSEIVYCLIRLTTQPYANEAKRWREALSYARDRVNGHFCEDINLAYEAIDRIYGFEMDGYRLVHDPAGVKPGHQKCPWSLDQIIGDWLPEWVEKA